jgi:hypothetical protein
MNCSYLALALGAVLLLACGDVAPEVSHSSSSGTGGMGSPTGASSTGGAGSVGASVGSTGAGGQPPSCNVLAATSIFGGIRWQLDPGIYKRLWTTDALLVDTGLDGDDSTLLLLLATAPDASTVLLASRFDGGKTSTGYYPDPLSLAVTAIPLPSAGNPTALSAVRGAPGKVQVLLTGSAKDAQWIELDAKSASIEATHDLGAPAGSVFLAASPTETLAGVHATPFPSAVSLVSDDDASVATAPSLGCADGTTPAAAVATNDGFLVAFTAGPCAAFPTRGLYVGTVAKGSLVGAPVLVDVGFPSWLPSLVRSGDQITLFLSDTSGIYSGVYAMSLALDGTLLDAPLRIGGAIGAFSSFHVGAHSVVPFFDSTLQSVEIVTEEGKSLGKSSLGPIGGDSSPVAVGAIGGDTMLVAWSHADPAAADRLVHINQFQCRESVQ